MTGPEGGSTAPAPALVDATLLLDAVPDGLWMLDDEGRTTYANARMAEMLGLRPDDMTTLSAYDVLDEQGRRDLRDHLVRRHLGTAPRTNIAYQLYRADGTTTWTMLSHSPVVGDDGEVQGFLYRARDYDEQRALLDELIHRDERFAELQALARIGSWAFDVRTGEATWSEETYRLCRVHQTPEGSAERDFFRIVHPDHHEILRTAYARLLERSVPIDVEVRLLDAPHGLEGAAWLRIRGVPDHGDHGEVVRVRGTVQDVTQSKEHTEGVQFLADFSGAANRAQNLLELYEGIDRRIRLHSGWVGLYSSIPHPREPERLYHAPLQDDIDPELAQVAKGLADRARRTRSFETAQAPGGTVLLAGPALRGDRVAAVVVSDTGARTAPSAADRALYAQMLGHLSLLDEREEAARALSEARDQALRASRAKSEFLATMSHEIRTPLNGVIGLTELLRHADLDERQSRLAEGIDRAGRNLLLLVNDVLDLSKIEAGHLELEEVDFDLVDVLEQSVGLVAGTARAKGLDLVVSYAADVPRVVCGDSMRFGQVVTNLASNAVKFTRSGEVSVRASWTGSAVRVDVRDTGIGIAPDAAERLFEPFTQADSSTTRHFGGTGLGLAISSQIVAATGGEIGVSTDQPVGTTFWFTMRFGEATGTTTVPDTDVLDELRALVVASRASVCSGLADQLGAWKVATDEATTAPDATALLDRALRDGAAYDVVVVDEGLAADTDLDAGLARHGERGCRVVHLGWTTEPPSGRADHPRLVTPVLPSALFDTLVDLLPGVEDPEDVELAAPHSGAGAGTPEHRGRILVVEDNQINQLVAEGMLTRLGYEVEIAGNGAVCLSRMAGNPDRYDAVLMDCQMPVIDGFDATRAVRALQGEERHTPIIAMTAAALTGERERCLEAGMDDFLTKPVDRDLLAEVLAHWVGRGTADDGATAGGGPRDTEQPTEEPTEEPNEQPAEERAGGPAAGPEEQVVQLVDEDEVRERLDTFLDVYGVSPQNVAAMLSSFAELSGQVAHAAAGSAPGDLAARLHTLKGAAANLGLPTVAAVAERLEPPARDGACPSAAERAELEGTLAGAAATLTAYGARRLTLDPTP
ncbi:ATP-binding protein [Nocardioides flavescens]|uniref:Circadian input-output histidine kinase CikA n=1 Tax=Nocardioides flavescens TaxID=2691959 RepID=A0A6L7F2C0_9ACTN|nr:response regulator [Nocardioides flavescens]